RGGGRLGGEAVRERPRPRPAQGARRPRARAQGRLARAPAQADRRGGRARRGPAALGTHPRRADRPVQLPGAAAAALRRRPARPRADEALRQPGDRLLGAADAARRRGRDHPHRAHAFLTNSVLSTIATLLMRPSMCFGLSVSRMSLTRVPCFATKPAPLTSRLRTSVTESPSASSFPLQSTVFVAPSSAESLGSQIGRASGRERVAV